MTLVMHSNWSLILLLLQMSSQFPFIGHRPVRVHIMGTDEQPVADADSAEQLAVMFFDLDSAVNVAVGQHALGSSINVTLRSFQFR